MTMTTLDQVTSITDLSEERRFSRSLFQDALLHFVRDRLTIMAFIVLVIMTVICVAGPIYIVEVLEIDPNETSVSDRFLQPGEENYFLGTDHLGRDQFVRLIMGGQVSLAIAYFASVMSIVIGVSLGLFAGFYGGMIDDVITWFINTLSSIPPIFLLLIASAIWQPSASTLIIILGLIGWVGTCRLVRGEVLSLRERDYVLAARALGASNFRLMVYHIFPNIVSIVIVTLTIIAGNLILIESGLSFLGVGVQPPTPTWGNMLTDSRSYFANGVHLVVTPGLLIMITVLCFYLVGDGLRDALDPRSSRNQH